MPVMLTVAVIAAAGPEVWRAARRARLPTAGWRRWGRRPKLLPSAGLAARPDGALDEDRTLHAARALLADWQAGDTPLQAESDELCEAALGLAMLEWAAGGAESVGGLSDVRSLSVAHGDGRHVAGALRKATTAAARRSFGRDRDIDARGIALGTSRKDTYVGALLLLGSMLLLAACCGEVAVIYHMWHSRSAVCDAGQRAAAANTTC